MTSLAPNVSEFEGKTALVTGAGGGIGRAITRQLLAEGYRVLGQTTQTDHISFPQGLEIYYGDFSSPQGIYDFIGSLGEEIEAIDILINCAGSGYIRKPFIDLEYGELIAGLSVNFLSAFLISQAVLPSMVRERDGVIVNIGSNTTSFHGSNLNFDYFIAKSSIEAMTLYLNKHFAEKNIRVNCIKPGLIDSGMREKVPGYDEMAFMRREKMIPGSEAGLPSDVANMVLFLVSEAAGYISGQVIAIAGGE